MWGYEGEELSDIEATYRHVKSCRPDVFLTTVSYPITGTPYYEEVAPKLVQLGEWNATTDRDVQIRGRHSRRFYQMADKLLRSETRGRSGVRARGSGGRLRRGGGMSAAFDRLAATYDAVWTNAPIGRAQRDQVWRGNRSGVPRRRSRARPRMRHRRGRRASGVRAACRCTRSTRRPQMVREASRRGGFTTEIGGCPARRVRRCSVQLRRAQLCRGSARIAAADRRRRASRRACRHLRDGPLLHLGDRLRRCAG